MAVPIIRQLKKLRPDGERHPRDWEVVIADAPPGTSCPVVEAVRGADFALLVTEPTPFGLHDLRLMVEVVRELNIPAGVVINRDGIGDAGVDRFCAEAGLPVLMRIPMEREIGEAIARGQPLIAIRPEYGERLRDLYRRIRDLVDEAS
jgi:MinD superfamily P-loop ATPase